MPSQILRALHVLGLSVLTLQAAGLTLPSAAHHAQCHPRLAPVHASATFAPVAEPIPCYPGHGSCAPVDPELEAIEAELDGSSTAEYVPPEMPISPVIALQTLSDLEVALGESAAHGRLAVLKFYAPWCPACRVVSPKYERDAKKRPDHDWYEVNLKTARPIFKHANVTTMPIGVVYAPSGEQLFQHELKKSQYIKFVEKLDLVASAAEEEDDHEDDPDKTRDSEPLII